MERRHLLASLQGIVREDQSGMGQALSSDPGLPGIGVYLDFNNDGQLSPGEPLTETLSDDPATVEDESGFYSFDVPPGDYVVRQLLNRSSDQDLGNDQVPRYLQTAPLRDTVGPTHGMSDYAQLQNSYAPIRYTFEFSGAVTDIAADVLPPQWRDVNLGTEWFASFSFGYHPNPVVEPHPSLPALRYRVIDAYELRFNGAADDAGVAEAAHVDAAQTELVVINGLQVMQVAIPLMADSQLWMVIDARLTLPATDNRLPQGGEVIEPLSLRVMRGTTLDGTVLLASTSLTHHWSFQRADRFGIWASLPADEDHSFDFWDARDDDEDGLPNRWEELGGGLDVNGDGQIDLDLASRGADPSHRDLFVEVDAMIGRAPIAMPQPQPQIDGVQLTGTVLDEVARSFANAPVRNPDGTEGIRLHIDLDETDLTLESFTHADQPWHEFDIIAQTHAGGLERRSLDPNQVHTLLARTYVYRYALFADTRANGSSGLAEISGNNFFVTLGDWTRQLPDGTMEQGGTEEQQAGSFMHELGHTLGLRHGGDDDFNFKPNYLSVMNYHWQVPNQNDGWELDYSRSALPTLDPLHLDEQTGIGAPLRYSRRAFFLAPDILRRVGVTGSVDWNRNGDDTDTDVAVNFYRGFQFDSQGQGRSFDYFARDDATFEFALASHNDWLFSPEDFYLPDDPEFADGVHQCDNPEHSEQSCYEDTTDFFTLSVSPDPFEPNDRSTPVALPYVDWFEPFDLDLLSGEATGIFSLHNLEDYDWFLSPELPQPIGKMTAKIKFDSQVANPPELLVYDANGRIVGQSRQNAGLQVVDIDLGDLPADTSLYLLVKRRGQSVDDQQPTSLTVDPLEGLRYQLQVYAPRLELWTGSHWDGAQPDHGQAGDGVSWNDPRNWSVDDVVDTAPQPETAHVFDRQAQPSLIGLAENVVVDSLQFASSQTICSSTCPHTLTVQTGLIDVYPDVSATVNAALDGATLPITKQGQGTLALYNDAPSIAVYDGRLTGAPHLSGDLFIGPHAIVEPKGNLVVDGVLSLDGTLAVDVAATTHNLIEADTLRFAASSVLLIQASTHMDGPNLTVQKTIVTGETVQDAAGDQLTIDEWRGADRSNSQITDHAGYGVFLRTVTHETDRVNVSVYQASAGDTNGDETFESADLILALQAGAYESDVTAGWLQGDWNGDGRFDTTDLVVALQQGTYAS
ncbi:MAG: hypothetical protein KDA92_05865 [Planctomycetales bacterium]|nr:hypothetical protein [Planctomycetales bacterium]